MKKEIVNDTNIARYVPTGSGIKLLQPGESVMVDASDSSVQMVDNAGPKPAKTKATDDLAKLLKKPIADITPQLEGFDAPTLKNLLALEQKSSSPRVSLVAEIEKTLLAKSAQ